MVMVVIVLKMKKVLKEHISKDDKTDHSDDNIAMVMITINRNDVRVDSIILS